MDLDREKKIGERLRDFRESLQIPRSRFAIAIGYGTERIASYEAGRSPLPYDVFKAVSRRYQISPLYLALGRGSPKYYGTFDDSSVATQIAPRATFIEVFDTLLALDLLAAEATSTKFSHNLETALKVANQLCDDDSIPSEERRKFRDALAPLLDLLEKFLTSDLKLRKLVGGKVGHNKQLTDTETSGLLPEVKAQLPRLLERLKKAAAETGKKSELAKFLSKATGQEVPLASVSRWLSGEREPGGEVALQLDYWATAQGYPRAK